MKLQTVQYRCFLPTLLDLSCGGQGRGEIRLCGKNRVRRPSVGLAQYLCCMMDFCFNTVYMSHLHFVLQLLFFPYESGMSVLPYEGLFADRLVLVFF